MKIGQKLFQALLSECTNNNMRSLLVWVVTNNPSKTFYEKFNPEKIDTKFLEITGGRDSVLLERY